MNNDSNQASDWNESAHISCAFSFKCPKTWNRLSLTSDPQVRHCPECDQGVHLALTEDDFRRYADEGLCIAVPVAVCEPTTEEGVQYFVGMPDATLCYGD
jgi:hypothetical protein